MLRQIKVALTGLPLSHTNNFIVGSKSLFTKDNLCMSVNYTSSYTLYIIHYILYIFLDRKRKKNIFFHQIQSLFARLRGQYIIISLTHACLLGTLLKTTFYAPINNSFTPPICTKTVQNAN